MPLIKLDSITSYDQLSKCATFTARNHKMTDRDHQMTLDTRNKNSQKNSQLQLGPRKKIELAIKSQKLLRKMTARLNTSENQTSPQHTDGWLRYSQNPCSPDDRIPREKHTKRVDTRFQLRANQTRKKKTLTLPSHLRYRRSTLWTNRAPL